MLNEKGCSVSNVAEPSVTSDIPRMPQLMDQTYGLGYCLVARIWIGSSGCQFGDLRQPPALALELAKSICYLIWRQTKRQPLKLRRFDGIFLEANASTLWHWLLTRRVHQTVQVVPHYHGCTHSPSLHFSLPFLAFSKDSAPLFRGMVPVSQVQWQSSPAAHISSQHKLSTSFARLKGKTERHLELLDCSLSKSNH